MKARTQKRAAAYLPRGIMAVNPKAFGEEFFLMGGDVAEAPFRREGDAAIVDICGPLFSKAHWCWDSYEDILERVGAAFKSDAARVVMCLDSPGGDAAGCLEAARMLRAMALTAGKPLIAWTETQACSAAYALACAATEIYCTPTGCLGSIGIIDAFVDVTAQDAAYGMRYTFVTSGARKADGNPHVPTSKDALAVKQGQIDTLAALFFGLVEELRGVPASAVQALQAGVFYGADAVSAGLANETRVWSEVISNSQSGGGLMAKSTFAELASRAESEDEKERTEARKALRALLAEDGGGDAEPDGDEKKKKDEEAAATKASADEDEKKKMASEEEKAKALRAQASAGGEVDLKALVLDQARQLATLKASLEVKADTEARTAILATRPDLSADAIKALTVVSTKDLTAVLATFPRVGNQAAAAANVTPTRGAGQGDGSGFGTPAEEAFIERRMGLSMAGAEIKREGTMLELGMLTPDQARKHLEKMNGATKGGN